MLEKYDKKLGKQMDKDFLTEEKEKNDFLDKLDKKREGVLNYDGHRHRLFLEIVTACYGNCTGCALSSLSKEHSEPRMSIEMVREALAYFRKVIQSKENIKVSDVNLITGDYFLMPVEYIDKLFAELKVHFDIMHDYYGYLKQPKVTFTTSALKNVYKCKGHFDAMLKYFEPHDFAVEAVIDPLVLDTNYKRYVVNLNEIQNVMPYVDILLNLHSGVKQRHFDKLKRFMDDFKLVNLEIQYAINGDNDYRVKTGQKHVGDLINDIINHCRGRRGGLHVVTQSLSFPAMHDDNIFELTKLAAKLLVEERAFVNHDGAIYPVAFGYGDILLDSRYGFPKKFSIYQPYDEEGLIKEVQKYLLNLYKGKSACHTCEFVKDCYTTGYAFYNRFDTDKHVCENVGRNILELSRTNFLYEDGGLTGVTMDKRNKKPLNAQTVQEYNLV